MTPGELLDAIRAIVLQTDVVAMDVVEVSPPYDHAEVTAQLANRCVLEAISALAVKRRNEIGNSEDVASARTPRETDRDLGDS